MLHLKLGCLLLGGALAAPLCLGGVFERGRTIMICHRMANRDVPENTLDSLRAAARLGCDAVEIDVIQTRDGVLALLHDGPIDRLSDGSGIVNEMLWDELRLYDMGSWMGARFTGMQIPRFVDALRLARDLGLAINLDIKTEGAGLRVLEVVRREGMLDRVRFGGLWDDVRQHYPGANEEQTATWSPEMPQEQLRDLQEQGKFVIANFSANGREMDLELMKRAAAARVDAINTDYPRLAADALGRPVEAKVRALLETARKGRPLQRARAALEAAEYRDFALESPLASLLGDPDADVARAAAVALVKRGRDEALPLLRTSLSSNNARERANAAWALGLLGDKHDSVASVISELLTKETDTEVLREALFALARLRKVPSGVSLEKFVSHQDPIVTGAAALAAARADLKDAPALAETARDRLRQRIAEEWKTMRARPAGERPTAEEIRRMVNLYRGYVKLAQSLDSLPDNALLFEEAFRPSTDMTQSGALVAGFLLWDHVARHPSKAIEQLGSNDATLADRAEWALVKAGPQVAAAVRSSLNGLNGEAAKRGIRVLAWLGDKEALPQIRAMAAGGENTATAKWAIEKIESIAALQSRP